jgi:hypothetical protein
MLTRGPIKISKTIPARKKRYEITWINHDFMEMSQRFRDVRKKHKNKGDKCWWCGHSFEDGEVMALVGVAKKLNQIVCQRCAKEIGGGDG